MTHILQLFALLKTNFAKGTLHGVIGWYLYVYNHFSSFHVDYHSVYRDEKWQILKAQCCIISYLQCECTCKSLLSNGNVQINFTHFFICKWNLYSSKKFKILLWIWLLLLAYFLQFTQLHFCGTLKLSTLYNYIFYDIVLM